MSLEFTTDDKGFPTNFATMTARGRSVSCLFTYPMPTFPVVQLSSGLQPKASGLEDNKRVADDVFLSLSYFACYSKQ